MKTTIRNFRRSDRKGILHILAYYSRQSMAAYAEEDEDARYFKKLFKNPSRYPFYVIYSDDRLVGFGMLRPYSKLPVFSETAEVTYFILPEFTQKGIGRKLLEKLEYGAKESGICQLLANISSFNDASLNFHLKYGFTEVGRFRNIGRKFGQSFDVVWMQKSLLPD